MKISKGITMLTTALVVVAMNILSAVNHANGQETSGESGTPSVKATIKPTVKPVDPPSVISPVIQPTVKSVDPSVTQPTVKPTVKSVDSPVVQPTVKPTVRPIGSSPEVPPVTQPTVKPTVPPTIKPTVKPAENQPPVSLEPVIILEKKPQQNNTVCHNTVKPNSETVIKYRICKRGSRSFPTVLQGWE